MRGRIRRLKTKHYIVNGKEYTVTYLKTYTEDIFITTKYEDTTITVHLMNLGNLGSIEVHIMKNLSTMTRTMLKEIKYTELSKEALEVYRQADKLLKAI